MRQTVSIDSPDEINLLSRAFSYSLPRTNDVLDALADSFSQSTLSFQKLRGFFPLVFKMSCSHKIREQCLNYGYYQVGPVFKISPTIPQWYVDIKRLKS